MSTRTETPTPTLYVSTYTIGEFDRPTVGRRMWSVIERSMSACAHTDEETARAIYAQLRERHTVWQNGERVNPLPIDPPVWDGDAGEFRQAQTPTQPSIKSKQCPVCRTFFMSVPQKDHHVAIRHG